MIIGKASAESAKTANTQQHNYSFCCNQTLFSLLAHKMIARAWQVSHASPGDAYVWSATGEDRLQRGESKGDDELARDIRRPTMSLGRRMIQWMEWRCMASDRFQLTGDLVGFQFFIPFLSWWTWSPPLSMGWPAFVSVFISSAINHGIISSLITAQATCKLTLDHFLIFIGNFMFDLICHCNDICSKSELIDMPPLLLPH